MSAEGAAALFERITTDENFRSEVEGAATPNEKHRIVTEAGYDVTPDDIPQIKSLAGVEEISDDDLEKVAGGLSDLEMTGLLVGGGVAVGAIGAAAALV